ncbi:MAG: hypothetical protein Q9159_004026 [Coniocarpon cinnabarinum]
MDALNSLLLDPNYHDPLAILKAARNGVVYGTKIRFPHALVMVLLFRTGTTKEKTTAILKATKQHATNLATFAIIYKSLMLLLRRTAPRLSPHTSAHLKSEIAPRPRSEPSSHSFISGLIAGYCVFGRRKATFSSVNQQIVIYVFARVVLGLAKLAVQPRAPVPKGTQAGYGEVSPGGFGALDGILNGIGLVFGSEIWTDERRAYVRKRVERDSWTVFASVSWAMVMWLFRWHPDVLQPSLRSSMKYLYDNAENWTGVRDWIWHNQ